LRSVSPPAISRFLTPGWSKPLAQVRVSLERSAAARTVHGIIGVSAGVFRCSVRRIRFMDTVHHVLFVEDDPEIRGLVADFLRQSGFRVTVAQDGGEMDRVMSTDAVDLLILDIMLPREDGLSLCRRVRAAGNLPVIMLTARGSEIDRVVGLEMGADDYLTKPFSSNELLARIRALLRRAQFAAPEPRSRRRSVLTFGDWRLDLVARRLHSRDGTRVPLTGGEFELLVAFCEHANKVLTREQLLDFSRGRAVASGIDRSIDIQVSRLRRKIEKDPKDPVLIQTVRSGGYVLAAEVALE
jgi:two-component system, OmpR family, response regulator